MVLILENYSGKIEIRIVKHQKKMTAKHRLWIRILLLVAPFTELMRFWENKELLD